MSDKQAPVARSEPREIAELRRLKDDNPDLASAADLQIELLQLQRRIQARVPLPSIKLEPEYLNKLLADGPILQFEHLPIDWSDFRVLVRGVATAMRRHDALDETDYPRAEALSRDTERLPAIVRSWYEAVRAGAAAISPEAAGLEPVLQQAMRPFLTRAADAVMARSDLAAWNRGSCPLCGGEPDLAVITAAADRLLICGRCAARWRFDQLTCPFCLNADRARITSFASRDGQYRLYACGVCERYLKAYDARNASRPVMPVVDSVATLPLDAAAIQKGFR
ncbi:MAG TPA: formate dehydrogenase accessory protein FdhE [Vicinamibacterales bacterium]|nr:formate dehydrogenase accessory protein FdhE [Vicinamibacterales bacterium]